MSKVSALSVACPTCFRPAGRNCTRGHRTRSPHGARVELAGERGRDGWRDRQLVDSRPPARGGRRQAFDAGDRPPAEGLTTEPVDADAVARVLKRLRWAIAGGDGELVERLERKLDALFPPVRPVRPVESDR